MGPKRSTGAAESGVVEALFNPMLTQVRHGTLVSLKCVLEDVMAICSRFLIKFFFKSRDNSNLHNNSLLDGPGCSRHGRVCRRLIWIWQET